MTDVQLYVYDLSNGLARQMSMQMLGTQIDAVYHTSIVMRGVEYFFGAGIQMSNAGQTHHGRPMEVIALGSTSLPDDLIMEYLSSLKEIYTPESYDLFMHNCNNFSNDFAMFLVGKGVPDRISSLPKTVLETPFGQMLRPMLDQSMRSVTQAPVAPPTRGPSMPRQSNGHAPGSTGVSQGKVVNMTSLSAIEDKIRSTPSAVIFFTSATCAPCKIAYPAYDELAAEAGSRCALIKVDISIPEAFSAASKYSIRATPTFVTFLKGQKQEEWSGADPSRLRGNVRLLIQMAVPAHPHANLRLPLFTRLSTRPVLYTKVPPLEKLVAKMGSHASAAAPAVDFIKTRNAEGARDSPVPDLKVLSSFFRGCLTDLPTEVLFTAYDLLRLILVDQRVSAVIVEERQPNLLHAMLEHVNNLDTCPYNLRLVAIHMACNLFSSPVAAHSLPADSSLCSALTTLIANSLLDKEHSNLRVAATSLAYNFAATEYEARVSNDKGLLSDNTVLELAVALVESLSGETESPEAVRGMAVSLGRLVYKSEAGGEVTETCTALEAATVVEQKTKLAAKEDQALMREIGGELLKRGLA